MTALSAIAANPTALLNRLRVSAPEPRRLTRLVRDLATRAEERASAAAPDIAEVQQRVASIVATAGAASLTNRDLRDACRTMLLPPHPPARQAALREALIHEVRRRKRRVPLLALLDAYVDGFVSEDRDVEHLATALSDLVQAWQWRDYDPWPARLEAFDLLNAREAPGRVCEAMLTRQETPQTILTEVGLDTEGRRKGGLAIAAFEYACDNTAAKRGQPAIPLQQSLLNWCGPAGSFPYPSAWPALANALFNPWAASEPPPQHKSTIMDFAIAYAGDPRLAPARWRSVQERHPHIHNLVIGWLTRASVEQFFDVVGQTMMSRPDMWNERRTFWTTYLKANAIHAAWVAFGEDGAARAKRAAERSNDSSYLKFGRHDQGTSRTSEHAALLMQIGDLTIVEWSHNGRWNIWRTTDPSAPKLFKAKYSTSELMWGWEFGAHQSQWQYKVAEIIRRETGVRR